MPVISLNTMLSHMIAHSFASEYVSLNVDPMQVEVTYNKTIHQFELSWNGHHYQVLGDVLYGPFSFHERKNP